MRSLPSLQTPVTGAQIAVARPWVLRRRIALLALALTVAVGAVQRAQAEPYLAVQQGFKAAAPGTAYMTLANRHEAKIRHFHELYDKVLGMLLDAAKTLEGMPAT